MENLTGFIVQVLPKNEQGIKYQLESKQGTCQMNLKTDDVSIGYFWQMTGCAANSLCQYSHVHEIKLIDQNRKLFEYYQRAVFYIEEVDIKIVAKRGPESNNRYLSSDFDKYDTWNSINNSIYSN